MTKKSTLVRETLPVEKTPPPDPPDWEKTEPPWPEGRDTNPYYNQPKVKNLFVRVSDEIYDELERVASTSGLTTADTLRQILYAFLLPDLAIKNLEEYRPVFDASVPYDMAASIAYVEELANYLKFMKNLLESLKDSEAIIDAKFKAIMDALNQISIWQDQKSRSDRVQLRKEGEIIP